MLVERGALVAFDGLAEQQRQGGLLARRPARRSRRFSSGEGRMSCPSTSPYSPKLQFTRDDLCLLRRGPILAGKRRSDRAALIKATVAIRGGLLCPLAWVFGRPGVREIFAGPGRMGARVQMGRSGPRRGRPLAAIEGSANVFPPSAARLASSAKFRGGATARFDLRSALAVSGSLLFRSVR